MKIATSELEHLREEVKNCHRIIKDLQKNREFVGLTDEEVMEIAFNFDVPSLVVRTVEAKLRSKNEDRN